MKLAYVAALATTVVATAALLTGCGEDADTPPDAPPPAPIDAPPAPTTDARPVCYSGGGTPSEGVSVELGTGESGFESLADADEIGITAGLQGGYHFVGHARAEGIMPGAQALPPEQNPVTHFRLFRADGVEITGSECSYPRAYVDSDAGGYELPYGQLLIVSRSEGMALIGEQVRITVEVLDGEGNYASDERQLTVVSANPADAGVPDAAPIDSGAGAAEHR
ncbi:MAG: hypothetical protein Tsb0020_09630 [Haliangiales bacterium]